MFNYQTDICAKVLNTWQRLNLTSESLSNGLDIFKEQMTSSVEYTCNYIHVPAFIRRSKFLSDLWYEWNTFYSEAHSWIHPKLLELRWYLALFKCISYNFCLQNTTWLNSYICSSVTRQWKSLLCKPIANVYFVNSSNLLIFFQSWISVKNIVNCSKNYLSCYLLFFSSLSIHSIVP